MPLFKKTCIDNGSLLEIHRRCLRRCRRVFLKDLDVLPLMEYMASDENLRQEMRDVVVSCPTREQRVSTFLDHLELRGERAFATFVEALKVRYKHLYAYLEEMIQTVNESDPWPNSEKASVNGIALRKMLTKRKGETHSQTSEDNENIADRYDLHDAYIQCYSVTTKGHLQKEKWITHADAHQSETASENEKSFMAVVMSNLVFRRIDWANVNAASDFRKPPNSNIPAYMFEKESNHVFAPPSRQQSTEAGNASTLVCKKRERVVEQGNSTDNVNIPTASFRVRACGPPPPVPPKPENLPALGSGNCPPLPKPRPASDTAILTPPVRTTSKISLPVGKVRPPVPKNKPSLRLRQSQSVHDTLAFQTKPLTPLLTVNSELNKDRPFVSKSLSLVEQGFDDFFVDNADKTSLDCNISVSSTLEPEDDVEQDAEDSLIETDATRSISVESVGSIQCDDSLDVNKNRMVFTSKEKLSEGVSDEQINELDTEHAQQSFQEQMIPEKEIATASDMLTCLTPPEQTANHDGEAHGDSLVKDTDTEVSEEDATVQYDLPPREDIDESPQPTGNDSDSLNTKTGSQNVLLPMRSVDQHVFADDEFSSDSYYEDIEQFFRDCPSPSRQSANAYLDPRMSSSLKKRTSNRSLYHYPFDELRKSSRKVLSRNSLVLVTDDQTLSELNSADDLANIANNITSEKELSPNDFIGTVLCYDREGCAFYIPCKFLKKYGDPEGEPWFYPLSISSRQASLFLSSIKQEGCFVVYRPENAPANIAYNLSMCLANGDVMHYRILENVHGDFGIEGHDHTFMTVAELVEYFRRNKSSLATRLRRPLKCAKHPITPGLHYDRRYELERNALALSGNIIGQGNFGVVCAGEYRNVPVAVKVLQKSENLTPAEEDDFIEEALALMELKHDNVVRLIGISCRARPYFLVTEYVSKGNLKDCLRNGVIPSDHLDVLFTVCIQVVSAMQYLESIHYMLHRDLAARNFLVDDLLTIKLADFGRTRHVSDDYYQAPRTEKICIKWAAPEVLVYSRYSTKSDVWAIGVVFWEIFSAGARPYNLFSGEQTAMYVTGGGRLDKPPGCPLDLFEVMKSCWLEEPDDRPSFHDLAEILRSKSSIYYSKPLFNSSDHRRLPSDGVKPSPTQAQPKNSTGKAALPLASIATKARKSIASDNKNNANNENLIQCRNDARYILRNEGPLANYLSDLSLATVSSEIMDIDREDVSRGDKIRKSLRKLINKKSKTKQNELVGKPVVVAYDLPTTA